MSASVQATAHLAPDCPTEAIRQGTILLELDIGKDTQRSFVRKHQRGSGFWPHRGFQVWQALRRHPGYQRESLAARKEVGCQSDIFFSDYVPTDGKKYSDWESRNNSHLFDKKASELTREWTRLRTWADESGFRDTLEIYHIEKLRDVRSRGSKDRA